MNAYHNLYQPWRSALQVWTVLAQAQTEFALRLMGMKAPASVVRRPAPAVAPSLGGAAVEAPKADAPAEMSSADVVALRLVKEASVPAAATAPELEALPEQDPGSDAIAALESAETPEEQTALAPVVTAEPEADPTLDLVQAAIQPLLVGPEDEEANQAPTVLAAVAKAHDPARGSRAPASRRIGKAKRP